MVGRQLCLLIQGLNLVIGWNVYKMLLNKINKRFGGGGGGSFRTNITWCLQGDFAKCNLTCFPPYGVAKCILPFLAQEGTYVEISW